MPDTAPSWLRSSGLDSTNGVEFVQERIALFAKVVAIIAIAFLLVGTVATVAVGKPLATIFAQQSTYADLAGFVILSAVWLFARRRRTLSLRALAALDAVAFLTSCTAWAFFVERQDPDSIYGAVSSVTVTTMVRAIIVPSSAGRTLRLSALAAAPVLTLMYLGGEHFAHGAMSAPQILVYQTLLTVAVIAIATITSRIIYELRRRVREANELGQYELEERLGAGGMGEVWRARHRFLVRPAAIKLIRPELLGAGGDARLSMRRFEREALTTAALRSPHTVQLYDFGQAEDGTLFYVMELLVGIDLERLVERFGPMPAARAVHVLKQVCHSLEEAHQNGLIHRDIKPANVFVTGVGTDLDFVKVLDFGLVRFGVEQAARGGDDGKLTAEGRIAGTPAYAAPEIALGEVTYDHRVDLYAVGCVGYWLLTGTMVFEAQSALRMLFAHVHTPPAPPSSRSELPIPPALEALILDCLAKDPARRPQSAAAIAARLGAVERELDEPWTPERAAAWWRTHLPLPPRDERPVAEVLLSRESMPVRVIRR